MRVVTKSSLDQLRELQNSNMPFWTDIVGPPSTVAGPKGQPTAGDAEIALGVQCRVSAADPDEVQKLIAGQQTTLDVIKVTLPYNTPLSKRYTLIITDDRRTYRAKIISIKPRHANTTAEVLYAQET